MLLRKGKIGDPLAVHPPVARHGQEHQRTHAERVREHRQLIL